MNKSFLALMAFIFLLTVSATTITAQKTITEHTQAEKNLALVSKLQPELVWKCFAEISAIPHCSKEEKGLADYIVVLATQKNFFVYRDSLHNLLIRVPATEGLEDKPSICLQSHLDMVCQAKSGSELKFPIEFMRNGDTLRANRTTLGADNGLGVATMLAVMMSDVPHCELELFFTAQEELGLVGAKAFDYSQIKSRRILNLDAFQEGEIIIGCAGATRLQISFKPKFRKIRQYGDIYCIRVFGQGGHSGIDIGLNRPNTISVMANLISQISCKLISFEGGSGLNTIPRNCKAKLFVAKEDQDEFHKVLSSFKLPGENTSWQITQLEDSSLKNAMTELSQRKLLMLLQVLPTGVISYEENSRLVRTSNNIGMVGLTNDTISIKMMARSSSSAELFSVFHFSANLAEMVRAEATLINHYSPWEPNWNGDFANKVFATYNQNIGVPTFKTIHGGLEAAIFAEKIPGIEIASIGPTIHNEHTPSEMVYVPSVARFWKLITELIAK